MNRWRAGIASAPILIALAYPALAADAPHRKAYIDGPWGQINVRVVGREGDPTVVLVHQMTWSSVQNVHAQDELATRGVRSIAVDIPGYGNSDGPDKPPTAEQYADALLPVLDAFKLQRAILLGTNTGSTLITALADRHAARVDRLILEGLTVWDAPTRRQLIEAPHFDQTPKADGSHLMARWNEIRNTAKDRLSLAAVQTSVMQFFNAGPREWYAHEAVFRVDLAPIVKRVKAPIAVLTYPGQPLYETSLAAKKIRSDIDIVVLNDVGPSMTPSYDYPQPWAEAVAKLVKR